MCSPFLLPFMPIEAVNITNILYNAFWEYFRIVPHKMK